jgi:hypothetical protein
VIAVVALAVGFAVGATLTGLIAVGVHRSWVGEHEARRTWLAHTDVQGVYQESDHNLRLARRLARALEAAEVIYRRQIGDLLDHVARLEHQPHTRRRPVHVGRNPVPADGEHR